MNQLTCEEERYLALQKKMDDLVVHTLRGVGLLCDIAHGYQIAAHDVDCAESAMQIVEMGMKAVAGRHSIPVPIISLLSRSLEVTTRLAKHCSTAELEALRSDLAIALKEIGE